MLNIFKRTTIAFAALTAISMPLNLAAAHPGKGAHTAMAIRNDLNNSSPVVVPRGYYPPSGSCRLWYPDRAATAQPAIGTCDVDVPLGAILLLG